MVTLELFRTLDQLTGRPSGDFRSMSVSAVPWAPSPHGAGDGGAVFTTASAGAGTGAGGSGSGSGAHIKHPLQTVLHKHSGGISRVHLHRLREVRAYPPW